MSENPYEPPKEANGAPRLTDRVRAILSLAEREADRLKQEYVGTEHVLLGMLREGSGVGCFVLRELGLDFDKIRCEVETLCTLDPALINMGKRMQTPAVRRVLDHAWSESLDMNHEHVGTEHLLL